MRGCQAYDEQKESAGPPMWEQPARVPAGSDGRPEGNNWRDSSRDVMKPLYSSIIVSIITTETMYTMMQSACGRAAGRAA